MVLEKLAD